MLARFAGPLALASTALLALAGAVSAQQGTLTGTVTNAETGAPISAAQIQVLGAGQATGTLSDNQGRYRIGLPPGSYDLTVTVVGYRTTRFDGIDVASGQTTTYDMQLLSQAQELDALVITASRGTPEKSTEAPASTYNVSSAEITERPAATLADHLKSAPGVDIITQGVQSTNVVVRGFNNIFSGALHMLTDHRLAGVPSLRVNLMHFLPSNDEDVDRMEVVLGPGSALYGPNTANGVVHILTKSPLDDQETTVTLGAGERDVFQGTFRTAFLLGEDFGVKLSGQYLSGTEWPYTDPVEQEAREQSEAACLQDKAIRGFSTAVAQQACQRVGIRDFDISRFGLEARADWRFAGDGTLVGSYGRTSATGIELTGLGAGQTSDWVYDYFQTRLNKDRFFTQAYYNRSDAGDTWLLRDGVPLIDKSTLFVAQVQHGFALADERQDFTYGVDYFATRPDTEGSINGSYEDEDDIDEWGAYVQSKTALTDRLDLIVAARLDSHSLLDDNVFSPRAALVFSPTEEQSFRATYNRAFSTPSSLNFFLDISGGAAPSTLGQLGYTTRAFGTGKDGYSFQNPDGTLRGMRSPFTPPQLGGAGQLLPADTGIMWDLLIGVLQAQGAISPQMAAQMSGWDPTNDDIARMLLDVNNPGELTPLASTRIPDVPGIAESYTETYEVGWTGVLNDRVKITADVYYMQKNDFVSPLQVQTPLLLLNGQDVGTFIATRLIQDGMDPAQAQATAAQLAPVIAQIPAGVVSSDQVGAQAADLIVTYRNVGDLDLWGSDFAIQAFVNDEWTVNGTYSWVSDDYFQIEGGAPIALNAPKHKGSLGLAYRNVRTGLSANGRARFSAGFPAESAGYVGNECIPGVAPSEFSEPCVDAFAIFDLNVGYQLPGTTATVQLAINNLFDTGYRSFVGVPTMGRFAMLRLRYEIF
jgi:outer membrane receptor for ferrienterochelin and colicins